MPSASQHHTLESFRARFRLAPNGGPEDDALVQSALDEAAVRTPTRIWGERTRAGHGYLAAHLLGMDAHGRDARLAQNDAQTSYGVLRDRMEAEIGPAVAPRVT